MKKQRFYLPFLALLGILGLPLGSTPVFGADLKTGESVKITAPVQGDLYVGTGEFELAATVEGDLIVAAGTLTIGDTVREDLLITGGQIEVNGWTGDDIRVGGGTVVLNGYVGGDVIAAAGNLTIGPDVVIEGDLILAGGEVEIKGTIKGEVRLVGGKINFRGSVQGAFRMTGGELVMGGVVMGPAELAAEKITLVEGARFEGEVRYWQEAGEMDFSPAMTGGTAVFDPELEQEWMDDTDWGSAAVGAGMFWLFRLLAVVLILIVFTWLFGERFSLAGEIAEDEFFRSMGIGALYLIGLPVLAVLLMVIVIGIPLGFLALSLYGLSLLFAGSITALVWAHLANIRLGFGLSQGMMVLTALVIFVLLKLIGMIPLLGWLVVLAATLVAFGALLEPVLRKD